MKNFFLIGLTGNLASGKSTVRRQLEQLGARGIDADLLAQVAIQRGTPAWFAIVREFGLNVLKFNGEVDRQKLGARVFTNPAALQRLEQITHPLVRAHILNLLRDTDASVVVVEAIKLFEAGLSELCDANWVVTCAPEIQIERVMRARQMSADHARARLDAQGSFEEKIKGANVVIDNSQDEQATLAQVKRAWDAIQTQSARDKTNWLTPPATTLPDPNRLPPGLGKPPPIISEPVAPPAPPLQEIVAAPLAEKPVAVPEPIAPPPAWAKPVVEEKIAPELELRRARKSDLDALSIAFAQRDHLANPPSRTETLQRFGARGYRVAVAGDRVLAFVAWEAENLVAVAREVWAESEAISAHALPQLFAMVEDEAKQLQCEVLLMLVDPNAPPFVMEQARRSNFQPRNLQELHPVWRQVVLERIQSKDEIWVKRLREELVTQPF